MEKMEKAWGRMVEEDGGGQRRMEEEGGWTEEGEWKMEEERKEGKYRSAQVDFDSRQCQQLCDDLGVPLECRNMEGVLPVLSPQNAKQT